EEFLRIGGTLLFETMLEDLEIKNGKVREAITSSGRIGADHFIIAPGHSAHETYRMLMQNGVKFRTKNFAIGCRVEHPQELINIAQWGRESLPGVKAAEYRLTSKGDGNFPVYTFCMCPGGVVVPAAAYENTNIVNGMSRYKRNGRFANAACVAGINPDKLLGREAGPLGAIDWLAGLEEGFYRYSNGYKAPFCSIQDFINKKVPAKTVESSYAPGLKPAALWDLLPSQVSRAVREGLKDFSRKIKGFDTGVIMGLESKTSSPIQVLRRTDGCCSGFENLYIAGEGSGHSGGIISSGADGIRAAMHIIERN
ncbi:MAG: FAD-dependent oxidoreductase, partial [Nitrospirota bacterium]|nr:FAD-dependent oxidoreductase [Nitrospirota bacterium]